MSNCAPTRSREIFRLIVAAWGIAFLPLNAHAVPAFGENCLSCHTGSPEKTSFGALFKLTGYTLGRRPPILLSEMIQPSPRTRASNASSLIDGGPAQPSVGIGGYFFSDRTLYGELTAYLADGAFSLFPPAPETFSAIGTYYYQRKYGATLAYFSTIGDADASFFSPTPITGSANRSPDTKGLIFEVDYIPVQAIKLSAQYTAYRKFNGAGTNYDGFGRNASDNNTFYMLGRFSF